jgi:hypothetical protein
MLIIHSKELLEGKNKTQNSRNAQYNTSDTSALPPPTYKF